MTETVTAAVARRDASAAAMIGEFTGDFATVLPSHIAPQTFVRLSQGLLRRDTKLAEAAAANPGAFLAALLDCARLGHEPGTDAYALVPIKDKGRPSVLGIEQYQGEIERMYRAGAVSAVKAAVVRERDFYEFNEQSMTKPNHRPGWWCTNPPGQTRHARFLSEQQRGELVGAYAYGEFPGGAVSRVVEMGRDEIMKHKAASRGADSATSPWNTWEPSMWLKTVVHELEKWVPTSAEYRREQLRAAVQAGALRRSTHQPHPAAVEDEVTDAEIVDDERDGGGESR